MPNILVVDNHSVDVDKLTGGPVLDAGCRGLRFAKWFTERGHRVIGLDPAPEIDPEVTPLLRVYKTALVANPGTHVNLVLTDDLEARFIGNGPGVPVPSIGLAALTSESAVDTWDVIKLNIEGSEYDILDSLTGPIANQIVFSFHEHTERARGKEECDRIISKLSAWYDIHNQVWEQRYCCRENYWDVLAIRRGI